MSQVTWRAADDVVDRVRRVAAGQGRSLNEFITVVLRAATDPDLAGPEVERVRERLAAAGLLSAAPRTAHRPDADAVARARARAGQGAELGALVAADRT